MNKLSFESGPKNINNPVDVYVGTRLKVKRSEMGISQDKLGKLTGITFQQIQKYEKGSNRIGSSRLYEFAKILGVTVSYFFEGYEAIIEGVVSCDDETLEKNGISEKEIITLIKSFSQVKDKKLRKIISDLAKNSINKEENSEEEELQ